METNVVLYWGDGQLPPSVTDHLREEGVDSVEGKPYGDILEGLKEMAVSIVQWFVNDGWMDGFGY